MEKVWKEKEGVSVEQKGEIPIRKKVEKKRKDCGMGGGSINFPKWPGWPGEVREKKIEGLHRRRGRRISFLSLATALDQDQDSRRPAKIGICNQGKERGRRERGRGILPISGILIPPNY